MTIIDNINTKINPHNQPEKNHKKSLAICVLASGSRGNSTYISDGSISILIDAGLSGKENERRMTSRGLAPESLNAIIISHEHRDHILGAGVLSRRYSLPVYISRGTKEALPAHVGKIREYIYFKCGHSFSIGSLKINPFSTSHDAEDPSGFIIEKDKSKIGIATDLGIATETVKKNLRGCSLIIIESNHDVDMLENGPYPWILKKRIKSSTGHLSNNESRELLKKIINKKLEQVILAHLSEGNNSPEKALAGAGEAISGQEIKLSVASQYKAGEIIYIKS